MSSVTRKIKVPKKVNWCWFQKHPSKERTAIYDIGKANKISHNTLVVNTRCDSLKTSTMMQWSILLPALPVIISITTMGKVKISVLCKTTKPQILFLYANNEINKIKRPDKCYTSIIQLLVSLLLLDKWRFKSADILYLKSTGGSVSVCIAWWQPTVDPVYCCGWSQNRS